MILGKAIHGKNSVRGTVQVHLVTGRPVSKLIQLQVKGGETYYLLPESFEEAQAFVTEVTKTLASYEEMKNGA